MIQYVHWSDYMQYEPRQPLPVRGDFEPYSENVSHEQIKDRERRSLSKTANGIGFFVLVYYLLIFEISGLISRFVSSSGAVTPENQRTLSFLLQIATAVSASLIAGIFYRLLSRRKISAFFPKSRIDMKMLFPMVLLGMGAAMVANNLASIFDVNISIFRLENSAQTVRSTQNIPEMLLYVVSTAIVPAFAEEFAFRGIFMGVMRKYGDAFAIITSSIMFGAMHGNTTQIVFAFTLGLIFAFVDCKANSIVPSVIIHFLNNFYSTLTDVLSANSGLDRSSVIIIHTGVILLFSVLGFLSYVYLSNNDKDFFKISNSDTNRFSNTDILPFKEKIKTFFTALGVIFSLTLFFLEMVYYLLPQDIQTSITKVLELG